jgi:CubicO group peptidase (beta-lactamase class C family)
MMRALATAKVALLLCASVTQPAAGQRNIAPPTRRCVDCLVVALRGMLDSAKIPGVALAVVGDGRRWIGAAGMRDVETRQAMNGETILRGASLGKPIFAYAVLKLVDQGRIALDTPLVRYAPREYLESSFFKGPMADTLVPRITARMVLSHSTGFPNWRPPGEPIRVQFAPGTRYSYSGEGYLLLQRVVEHVSGQGVEAFMQATVLRPLRMTRTTYAAPATSTGNVATAYGASGAAVTPPADEEPNVAHTVRTSAADYGRFLTAVMRGDGLRAETRREMFRPQLAADVCRSGTVSMGLGFALQRTPAGEQAFILWGRSPDASGYVLGFADRGAAVAYLTNVAVRGHQIGERIVKLALDHGDALLSCFGVRPYDAK